MKPIQLPKETIEALLNGASKFIVPIKENEPAFIGQDLDFDWWDDTVKYYKKTRTDEKGVDWFTSQYTYLKKYIKDFAPLQIGDEFYVQEEFSYNNFYEDMVDIYYSHTRTTKSIKYIDGYGILDNIRSDYKCTTDEAKQVEFSASQMTSEQSRIKDKVINVEVKRVQDLTLDECEELYGFRDYRYCYNKLNENYDGVSIEVDNPYVFIVTTPNKTN